MYARQGGVTPWSICAGIAGQFGVESVVSLRRNEWSICSGIRREIDSVEAGSKWMGGSSLEPPIGVAVKGANYDVRSPGIVIHPSVVWFVGL